MKAATFAASLFAALTCAAILPSSVHADDAITIDVKSRPITKFLIGSDQSKFGKLTFLGGVEMTSREQHFGALSGIAVSEDQSNAWLVSDTGFWLRTRITRDENGAPTGLSETLLGEITAPNGASFAQKWEADAEAVTIDMDGALRIAFERNHRLVLYQTNDAGTDLTHSGEYRPPVPLHELRRNRGFEGIAYAPATAPFPDALVGVSEKSLDAQRNIMAFVDPPGGGNAFEFSVKRTDEFDVTDIDWLPNGDLLLLERSFNISGGIAMRLRHIKGDSIKARATVDGETLLEADMRYQIDNMEGLSVTREGDNQVRLTLVSDDNKSILQRNLLLEFMMSLD